MREKRYIACRSGASSITTSMNCPPPGAGPTTRIAWLPVSSMVSKDLTIADHTVSVRMSMSWSIASGRSALASRRRCCPILIATARAPTLLRICRASESGTMPERRRIQHQRRGAGRRDAVVEPVHAEIGDRRHVDHQAGDHDQRNGEQQQLAGQAEPARAAWRPRRLRWSAGRRSLTRIFALITLLRARPDPNRPHCRWSHADLRGCVPPPDRSNYRSLMSAGSGCLGEAPSRP